jgi:hypothetical protein
VVKRRPAFTTEPHHANVVLQIRLRGSIYHRLVYAIKIFEFSKFACPSHGKRYTRTVTSKSRKLAFPVYFQPMMFLESTQFVGRKVKKSIRE